MKLTSYENLNNISSTEVHLFSIYIKIKNKFKFCFKGLTDQELNSINEIFGENFCVNYNKGNYYIESKSKDSSLFLKITPQKTYIIFPDDVIKIGNLEFLLMRYHVGIGREICLKTVMEDNDLIIQNLKISLKHSFSLFCVIDG